MQQETLKPECPTCSIDGQCEETFNAIVKAEGGRLTNERKTLLGIICDIKGHFQPDTLVTMLQKQGHAVALTTVYRNLSLLVKAGIIRKTDTQNDSRVGGAWYEHIWGREHHDHLICSRCGKKIEFNYPAIDVLQEAVAKEYDFTLERHTLELIGVCPDCRKDSEKAAHPVEHKKAAPQETPGKSLLHMKEGTEATIGKIDGDRHFVGRIHSFGLYEGKKIKLVKFAPFKGPLLIEDSESGARIMLARSLAPMVHVVEGKK